MKKKILLLATTDSHLEGHAWSEMEKFNKDKYDVKLITLTSIYNDPKYSLIKNEKIYNFLVRVLRRFFLIFKYKEFKFKTLKKRYCFFNIDYSLISYKVILNRYNFEKPDYIVLYWHDLFITPKILRKLYDKTKATIVYVFTDEFPLGGGCHYPCECEGYKNDCKNCPAVKRGNKYPQKKLKEKIDLLGSIPKIVVATKYSMQKAKESAFFKNNTKYINYSHSVDVNVNYTKEECRKYFNISNDTFVIMYGAMNINDERKGVNYFIEAMDISIKRKLNNYLILAPGDSFFNTNIYNINYPGKLSFNDLCKAYIASDIFVCPTIADSGPMMLKYSLACGTPVVTFPVGYAIDHIQHKENGYLAEYMNSEDLSKGILYFYGNKDKTDFYHDNCIKSINRINDYPYWGNTL